MQPEVTRDFEFGRRYLDDLKKLAGLHLIAEAPFEEDAKHATDLIVLRLDAVRIACRVRRPEYLARYGDEFTIRYDRPNGCETELAKIASGWGDYMIYGFAGDSGHLAAWLVGDLDVFRRWRSSRLWIEGEPGLLRDNHDGSSQFRAYRISDLPAEFVLHRGKTAARRGPVDIVGRLA